MGRGVGQTVLPPGSIEHEPSARGVGWGAGKAEASPRLGPFKLAAGLSRPKSVARVSTAACHQPAAGVAPWPPLGQACAGAAIPMQSAKAAAIAKILIWCLIGFISLAAAAPSMGGAPHPRQCRTGLEERAKKDQSEGDPLFSRIGRRGPG